ncbi:restriction endonuclease subunit S (plasmid) [Chromobacterium amazonense]|uniref:restriction endonuclease subunit S n=1 Tax=Chromobacterium amazonense TaxID=1382803 RepID=UPI00237D581C|nr:restriction endonuclease subunit S [Chromobacterium amazonense]MDE1713604.1 restriction endonuclease subunit S [Chromobacterium amazonense]
MSKLPQGWAETSLESIVDILDSKRIPLNSNERAARIAGKQEGDLVPYYGATGQVGLIDDYLFDEPLILLGEDGVPFFDNFKRKAYRINGKSWVNNHAHVLRVRTDIASRRYVEGFLNQFNYTGFAAGTTRLKLTQASMRAIPVRLAPLPEQKRIADKLDSVLARVDACRERLARVQPLLKRFRQSVLAAATSGRLTEDWRAERAPDYKSGAQVSVGDLVDQAAVSQECSASQAQSNLLAAESGVADATLLLKKISNAQADANIKVRGGVVTPMLADLPDEIELPGGWAVAGFDALAAPEVNALKAGPFGSALKKSMYVSDGYKIYGQEQVIAGDETIGDYFIDEAKFNELNSCAVKPGDILISLVGTIGRVLILSPHCSAGIINPRLVKLSLHQLISRKYIALYLMSPIAQHFFAAQSHGGTMDILNLGILRELPILLPSTSEQHEIVRRVETLFAFADRLESRLAAAQGAADKLTPALLAKAFRGELVPQDPNDEPAAELLKRLAAQRAAAPKPKRGRKAASAGD